MILKTARLVLRPWQAADAESLYEYARNPEVGPSAGWPIHTSVDNSRQIIKDVLSTDETYAVTLKDNDDAIGSIGLLIGNKSNLGICADEAEIGYWLGKPHWGQELIPEAVRELMRHAFCNLNMATLWCGYFDGNEKSKRAQEKCGFRFHHTETETEWPLIHVIKTLHVTRITKQEWSHASRCAGEKPGQAGQ
ncbi:MAG: GNAT family N-acetyltransferase [Oscillospiraceae bacterium]|nr:GNAT family N-acetyltransferase [Oscillospiraceae bacterium]